MNRLKTLSTIAGFSENESGSFSGEEVTFIRKTSLSGGQSMWRARLVLSTLAPRSETAMQLRSSIRRGDKKAADRILDSVFHERAIATDPPQNPDVRAVVGTRTTTVLPPAPIGVRRAAS